jgi:ribonuclease VapC
MFVDASAIIAILTAAPEAAALADALEKARSPITSPIAIFEAVQGIRRVRHSSVAEAQVDVAEFLEIAGVRSVSISAKETETALDAMSRYGVGTSHPAQLNLADCFSYAVSKNYRAPMLSAEERFALTDIKIATA